MQKKAIKINSLDNVAVALVNLKAGEIVSVEDENIHIVSDIKAKHKFALKNLSIDEEIIMYDVLVGKASVPINIGEIITTENTRHESSTVTGKTLSVGWIAPDVKDLVGKTFLGYHRDDGQVGTSNVWLFFPLVFCENRNIEILKDVFEKELLDQKTNKHRLLLRSLVSNSLIGEVEEGNSDISLDNIEVKFITHQAGCGGIRQDANSLAKLLAGYVNNPNVAGATVLSLGCQNLQIELFQKALNEINPNCEKPVLIYEQQKMGTVDNMLSSIIKDSYNAIIKANKIKRKPASLSKLVVGLECGGSDGFSGISANPTLGYVSDVLVALGATVILSEFPELVGVEQELVNRCVSDKDVVRFLELMKAYEKSVVDAGSGFDMNPSPGNIKDGLITDAMKSAGAAKKGGTALIKEVLDYGEYVTQSGLNLLCTPGNDVESTTAMGGSGASVILFTTGLGTPTGNPVSNVIKVSSNTELAEKMPDIIDFDSGSIIKGEKSINEVAFDLIDYIIEVASGDKKTKADMLSQSDFIPWRRGVSL